MLQPTLFFKLLKESKYIMSSTDAGVCARACVRVRACVRACVYYFGSVSLDLSHGVRHSASHYLTAKGFQLLPPPPPPSFVC